MSLSLNSANVYTDLNGLQAIRRNAGEDSPETLAFVAKQFEALFMQMMLKSAREGGMEDGLFDSEQGDFYQDMHDKQLAIELAQGRGMGIAEMLVQQLRSQHTAGTEAEAMQSAPTQGRGIAEYISAARSIPAVAVKHASADPVINETVSTGAESGDVAPADAAVNATVNTTVNTANGKDPAYFEDPQSFVEYLWPHAQKAGEQLGVSPHVLVAQAALETGWGKHVSRSAQGVNSHNLFNIKADSRWQGDAVAVETTEFRRGQMVKEQAQFRAYDSYAESFDDYVKFIQGSPRYAQALRAAENDGHYVRELQASGYATDPQYAHKIMRIVEDKPLAEALASLKLS